VSAAALSSSAAAGAAMELQQVMGLQGLSVTVPSPKHGDMGVLGRGGFTQAAAASYPSPFLDEQKMLRFSKAAAVAQTLPSG
jgi:hypothetical protein